jgi:hypothetical protein
VQAFWSSQLTEEWTQPDDGLQESVVHKSLSSQEADMSVKTQPWGDAGSQESLVQRELSLHTLGWNAQPVALLHESIVHELKSLHVTVAY